MDILILALATWRISSLLVNEAGPWDVFSRLRRRIGVVYDVNGEAHGTNVASKALTCMWCTSPYVGAAWMAFYWLRSGYAFWAALPFALSAGAVIINEVLEWLEQVRLPS